ncbi:MAG: hypothetical protein K6F51_02285 [Acetatifactor sp.]|nr:hypothetical protein [Acetatifactor sp.]
MFLGLQEELKQFSQIPRIRIRAGIYQTADKHSTVEERFDHAKLACDRIRAVAITRRMYPSTARNKMTWTYIMSA